MGCSEQRDVRAARPIRLYRRLFGAQDGYDDARDYDEWLLAEHFEAERLESALLKRFELHIGNRWPIICTVIDLVEAFIG